MSTSAKHFDIVVVGGGIVGLALVQLLAQGIEQSGLQRRIALLEHNPPEQLPADTPLDLRVSAIAPAARNILQTLGVWSQLATDRVCAYEQMCVWQSAGSPDAARSIRFSAAELGTAELGHIVENRAVRTAAWAEVARQKCVTLLSGRKIEQVLMRDAACSLLLDGNETVSAALVVGADGARSFVREQLGINFIERSYRQRAVVAHMASECSHANTAWQCFLQGGPVALLPLADGRSSLVWSCPEDQATELLALDPLEFAGKLTDVFGVTLGHLECTTDRAAFPLATGRAEQYTGRRFALLGDAAHRIHPLAGQGVNLGLLDASVLAAELLKFIESPIADPGDPLVLRRYERARKGDNLVTQGAMSAINALFSGPAGPIGGMGLEFIDKLGPLKSRFAAYAMGSGRA
jgi:2-octaprenylphenol hydroxylase